MSDQANGQDEPLADWLDALAEGDADVAAGRTVAWQDVKARLLAMIAQAEEKEARTVR